MPFAAYTEDLRAFGRHASAPEGASEGMYFDPREGMRQTPKLVEAMRSRVGDDVELLVEAHERPLPIDAVKLAKDLEPFRLFFLEDPLSPEDLEWFRIIRQQSATPLAMGELFTNPKEWQPLIENRLIDYVRMHVSQIGGITPAWNVAAYAAMYGIRTAWHGPGDFSPVGRAANLHLELWAPNFGVHEWQDMPEAGYEIFPGAPRPKGGYLYPNDAPGLGVDIDKKVAARFPCKEQDERWTHTRRPDGTPARP